jgi:hypothetical protein
VTKRYLVLLLSGLLMASLVAGSGSAPPIPGTGSGSGAGNVPDHPQAFSGGSGTLYLDGLVPCRYCQSSLAGYAKNLALDSHSSRPEWIPRVVC